MKMDNSLAILVALDEMGIPYSRFDHQPVWTIEDCLSIPQMDHSLATMPKNVFLCNRQQTDFYLLLLAPEKAFRTAVVSKLLGVSRLSFAPPEKLPEMLGLMMGAVSPLGLLFDREKRVRLVIDRALLAYERLWFHPGINTASLELSTRDFMGIFLPRLKVLPDLIDIPANEGE